MPTGVGEEAPSPMCVCTCGCVCVSSEVWKHTRVGYNTRRKVVNVVLNPSGANEQ